MPQTKAGIETAIGDLGRELWQRMGRTRPSVFAREYWATKLLDWAMDDPAFKVDLFRLVDVLPALSTREELQTHLQEYLARPGREFPPLLEGALRLSQGVFTGKFASSVLRTMVTEMARKFILGETPGDALPLLRRLHGEGLAHTVDLLGETTLSRREADSYQARYLELIQALADETSHWTPHAKHAGSIANVSLKLSALEPHLDPVDLGGSVARTLRRAAPIVESAAARGVFVNFDMEQHFSREITYRVFEQLAESPALRGYPHLGIVVQAYSLNAQDALERLLALARRRATPITIRLVKGAYWDYEAAHAAQRGLPPPVFTRKAGTDTNFERLGRWLLEHREWLVPAFGSHNLRSLAHAIAYARATGVPQDAYEIQTLHGMAEPLCHALRDHGERVRVYCPVGELLPGVAYLVRRLLENTANEGFLRLTYHEHADLDALLADPAAVDLAAAPVEQPDGFRNCPQADFSKVEVQERFARAVVSAPLQFPIEVPVIVGGQVFRSGTPLARHDPSAIDRPVASVFCADRDLAGRAVETAAKAWPAWRDTPLDTRSRLLRALADRLESRREELAALQVYEVGKPWHEADADVAEAIDFCRYYAMRAPLELGHERLGDVHGEINDLFYEGRGVAAVIAPWNFPLAILCGMSTAALVAGNTVVLKPAETSSATAHALYSAMIEAGFSPEVVQFLPGRGEDIGRFLVGHPQVAQVAFTGSKEVGLAILEQAGRTLPDQRTIKRVVCEMGGKNAILVDSDADLDEAISGVIASAFGYAGQKCSACSRAVVVGGVYDLFVERLSAACAELVVAPADQPQCQVPPVIDERAFRRLTEVIGQPGSGARRVFVGNTPDGGWFVPVSVFEVEDPLHRLMQEELFGPVLTLMRAASFDEAIRIALKSEFALTGGVYSRRPSHLELARSQFRVGNLYLNRGCTGAMVGRQAFGGFHLSGMGTKAGGPGYLRHFADPRSITENTMRRGFAPDITI